LPQKRFYYQESVIGYFKTSVFGKSTSDLTEKLAFWTVLTSLVVEKQAALSHCLDVLWVKDTFVCHTPTGATIAIGIL